MTRWLPWLVLLLPGGAVIALGMYLRRRYLEHRGVSDQWLREFDQHSSRVEFHGVRWKFPVKKIVNEHGQFNRQRLRRSA